jgi:hypothetical protein
MVQELSVFFSGPGDIESAVSKLTLLLGGPLEPASNEYAGLYEHYGSGFLVQVLVDHDLIDNCGIPFSEYSFQLSIYPLRKIWKYQFLENLQRYLALYLATCMNELYDWSCIVVEDLQTVLLRLPPTTQDSGASVPSARPRGW